MDETELAFAGIARQAALIAAGEVSSRELVELCLARIARLDPRLRAFRVVRADQARAQADRADARRAAGGSAPLLGVPFAVKDDMDLAGELTALGSSAAGAPARADSEVVARLRAAGAVIVGKTSVPELMVWPFTESAAYGVTRNPWDPARTPGGSSGGSAAAVAAGLVGAALGSDGGGSIRIPAAWCGLLGLKPQRDRVPVAPWTRTWHGLAVIGVLTRRVQDTALFHDVIGGGREFGDAVAAPGPRLRIGLAPRVPAGLIAPVDAEQRGALQATAELLGALGHEVRETRVDYGPGTASANFLARFVRGVHDEAAAIAHPERLERRTRAMARAGALIAPPLLARMRAAEPAIAARVQQSLAEHDVLLMPTMAALPPPVGRFEGRGALWTLLGVSRLTPFTPAWNMTGQPACAVPAGFSAAGLPLSIQLVGRPSAEATLLALAAELERERPWAQARPTEAPA
ncbi:MAG TPA: amidase [Solirubrobacteraceae bacterium]|jgi:amidase|nr:amidase [Solirubrobacteraceae bacterium]